jgi:hypothetical protein
VHLTFESPQGHSLCLDLYHTSISNEGQSLFHIKMENRVLDGFHLEGFYDEPDPDDYDSPDEASEDQNMPESMSTWFYTFPGIAETNCETAEDSRKVIATFDPAIWLFLNTAGAIIRESCPQIRVYRGNGYFTL